jgi:hypothetical protein
VDHFRSTPTGELHQAAFVPHRLPREAQPRVTAGGKRSPNVVIDRDNDGLITTASELSFLTEKPDARSDLEALGALDSNRDRKIDATDLRFGELKVWVDANRNGITDAGELKTLQELGIASISLAAAANQTQVKLGDNVLLATSSFTLTDGTVRTVGDAALAYKPSGGGSAAASSFTGALGAIGERLRHQLPDIVRGDAEAPDMGIELTRALRAGLDTNRLSVGTSGLSFDLPPGVNPFDFFGTTAADAAERAAISERHRQDIPAMLAPAEPDPAPAEGLAGPHMHLIDDVRVALMVQQMAGFGRMAGESELRNRDRVAPHFDYFA